VIEPAEWAMMSMPDALLAGSTRLVGYPDWAHGEIALPGLIYGYKITKSSIDRQTVNFKVEASSVIV
jgi:hypothetical protein